MPTRKPKGINGKNAAPEAKLRALSVYFITGSIKTAAKDIGYSTRAIYEWLKIPEIVAKAKKKANEFLDARCSEIVDLAHQGIVEKISTIKKRKEVSPEAMNRILGTALDKLMVIRELNKTKQEITGNFNFNRTEHYVIEIAEKEAKERLNKLVSSKNRIKDAL